MTFNFNSYRPDILQNIPEKELRKEYTRLRNIAQKRLKRLEKSEFSEDRMYQEYNDYFITLKEMSPEDLPYYLSDLVSFLRNKTSTLTGAREVRDKIIESLNQHNLGITTENFRDFYEFMNDISDEYEEEIPPSDQVALVWSETTRLKIDPVRVKEDFNFWYSNRKKLKKFKKDSAGMSYDEYKRYFSESG